MTSTPGESLTLAEEGYLCGVLAGEGHFGGDGKQAQITLRMHVRHERLFRWLESKLPGGRLYGPYHHGNRRYFQWMARGTYLRDTVLPILARHWPLLDDPVRTRLSEMCSRYRLPLPEPAAQDKYDGVLKTDRADTA
jgi:hypothetical protein